MTLAHYKRAMSALLLLLAASAAAHAEITPVQEVPCLIPQDKIASAYPLQKTTTEDFEKLIQSIGAPAPRNALEKLEKVNQSNRIFSVQSCGPNRMGFLQHVEQTNQGASYLRIQDQGETQLIYKLPMFEPASESRLQFSPDCSQVLLSGYETQPMLFDLKSGSVTLLPTARNGSLSYDQLSFSGNSKVIALDKQDLKEIDLNSGQIRTLLSQKGIESFSCQEQIKQCRLAVGIESASPIKNFAMMKVDEASGKVLSKQDIKTPKELDAYTLKLASDGTAVFKELQRSNRSWVLPPGSTEPVSIPGTNPVPLSGGKIITHHLYGTNAIKLEIIDVTNPSASPLELKFPTGVGQYTATSDSQGGAVVEYANNFSNSNYFSWKPEGRPDGKPKDGKAKPLWSASAAPDVKITEHRVQSTDGFEYPGYLYHKNGASKGVVVFVHGGGCHVNLQHSLETGFYDAEMLQVLDSGYDVFAVSYRNDVITDPPHPAAKWTKEQCGTQEIDDIVAANRYVRENLPAQPVFLYGHSQGAYLANLTVTQHAADAKWSGVISGAGMWQYRSDVPPQFMKENYSPDRAPIDYIDRLKTPMLLFHGRADQNVAFEHAQALMEKIGAVPPEPRDSGREPRWKATPQTVHTQTNGVSIDAYLPEGVAHHIGNPDTFETFSKMLGKFLDENSNR